MEKNITVENADNVRADVYLAEKLNYTRSKVKKLLDENKATVNGKTLKPRDILKNGMVIILDEGELKETGLAPTDIEIDIVYQDNDLAVINKPQGLTVHAGNGVKDATLVNALLYHLDSLSGINGVLRPGIVHRIDKDTSGLLVVAKNDFSHVELQKQIAEKTCKRKYVALLEGVVKQDQGVIETFIGRSTKNRTMMAVTSSGRNAVTHFKVLERFENYTYMQFELKTGRTHQIRVHSKHINHPIVGDLVYGYKSNKFNLKGQLLHATELSFTHPTTLKEMVFNAPLPDYFETLLQKLRKKSIK